MSDCSSEEVMNMIGENLSQKETKVCLGILLDMNFSYWISLYTLFYSVEQKNTMKFLSAPFSSKRTEVTASEF